MKSLQFLEKEKRYFIGNDSMAFFKKNSFSLKIKFIKIKPDTSVQLCGSALAH